MVASKQCIFKSKVDMWIIQTKYSSLRPKPHPLLITTQWLQCFATLIQEEGDLWDYLWFVSGPDFIKKANRLSGGKMFGFVAGRKRNESNKWDEYLIDKRDLANAIIGQMKRI